MDIYPPAVQRPALLRLAEAISCRAVALRRDECGDWRINGRTGHIYACPEGFLLMALTRSARAWTEAKRRLTPFASLHNDGDEEGSFILDRLPTAGEAAHIRRALMIHKRKRLSDEHVQKLREGLQHARLAA